MNSSSKFLWFVFAATTLVALPLTIGSTVSSPQQMEKRIDSLYRQKAFVASEPTLGQPAPQLELKTIDGVAVNLSDYFGQPLVLIKGSYT